MDIHQHSPEYPGLGIVSAREPSPRLNAFFKNTPGGQADGESGNCPCVLKLQPNSDYSKRVT